MINFNLDEQIDLETFVQLVYCAKPKSRVLFYNEKINDFLVDFFCSAVNSLDFEVLEQSVLHHEINLEITNHLECISRKTIGEFLNDLKDSTSCITLYTSGTSGMPKKVKHSIKWFLHNTRVSENYLNAVWGLCYNPTHMAGLQVIFQIVLNRSSFTYLFRKSKEDCYKKLESNLVTHISATPTFFKLIIPSTFVVNSVLRVTLGGEKADKMIFHSLKAVFPNARFNNIYATTELGTLLISQNDIFEITEKNSQQFRILGDELHVFSYDYDLNKYEWISTGDIVQIVNQNPLQFKFTARNTNFVNIGGQRVNIEEVEEIIESLEYIKFCRVYLRKSSIMNILAAEIVLKIPSSRTQQQIMLDLGIIGLNNERCPQILKIVDFIQVTRTGKIKR